MPRIVEDHSGTSPNMPTSKSQRCQEKGTSKELDSKLFEKTMKGNFPNLVKETDIQGQKAESQTRWTRRGPHQDTSQLKCQRFDIKRES